MKVPVLVEIPDGYELACEEMRAPKQGEWLINFQGKVQKATHNWSDLRAIVRPAWQWPEWLTAEWIAMDECGHWYSHRRQPVADTSRWSGGGLTACISVGHFAFTPPPCTDWTQSLRQNPRTSTPTER